MIKSFNEATEQGKKTKKELTALFSSYEVRNDYLLGTIMNLKKELVKCQLPGVNKMSNQIYKK